MDPHPKTTEKVMGALQSSTATPASASTVLPSDNVIALPGSKRRPQLKPFTKAIINKMDCPKDKHEALFWDPTCRGFGLRALSSGRRTWIYQYRDEHKRTRRVALGDVSAVALDAARQAARQHAASVTKGANPSAERKTKRAAASVLSIVEAYLKYAKARQRPRSYEETARHLLKHAAALHHERAEAVRRGDIASLLERLSNTSGDFAANRCRAALSAMWSWGLRTGQIQSDSSPVAFTVRHAEKARTRTLADDELRAIWTATADEVDYTRIVRLCLLTGCRREEIGGLQWEEIQADRLLIGADRMKAGSEHEVPLLPAIAIALPRKPEAATGKVFGRTGTGFSGWSKSKTALDGKIVKTGMNMPPWRLHDLRRTFSTRLHDAGVEPIVIEALLAHKQQGVAAVYNRASFRTAKRAALERWHELLGAIFGQDLVAAAAGTSLPM
jgi:integrase